MIICIYYINDFLLWECKNEVQKYGCKEETGIGD